METKSTSYKKLVEKARKNNFYIGEGNPLSNILIIGKECAIDNEGLDHEEKCDIVNEKNISNWEKLSIDSTITEIKERSDKNYTNEFYPLFPHFGQKFQQRRLNGDKGIDGTAPTWYFYQWLIDEINGSGKKSREDLLDFHLNSFHTELSQIPLQMSNDLPRELENYRRESIEKRTAFFEDPFFDHFPIVIVACGHYVRDYNINLEKIFKVKWDGNTINVGNKWINVHTSQNRVLIHTNQLSMISEELITQIAETVKKQQ